MNKQRRRTPRREDERDRRFLRCHDRQKGSIATYWPSSSSSRTAFLFTAMETIPSIVIPPSAEPHTHTVVFLHGRGDNANNFRKGLAYWRDSHGHTLADAFPSFRWVLPQAPMRRCASSPDTLPQWFDV